LSDDLVRATQPLGTVDDVQDGELAEEFRRFALSTRTRAPLYARLSTSIAEDPATHRLLLHAPPLQRVPVLLFAAVHALLLETPDDPLAAHYPNLSPHLSPARPAADPYPAFRAFCAAHEPQLGGLLAHRTTQTNEVGRCALFLPVLGMLADETGPLALVDVGTSAGLNLLLDRYSYVYEPGGEVAPGSPVALVCGTRGAVPVPAAMPTVVDRVGIDRSPIDVRDEAAARWLEACVWPDQADRFRRLRAAIELARHDPPPVLVGDAITDLGTTIGERTGGGYPVVLNSWVLSYLSHDDRIAFVAELDRIGATRDMSWISVEAPAQTSGLPVADDLADTELTVVTLTRWRDGARTSSPVATGHPHGYWLHWR
jgi:hypothetical protein